VTGVPNLSYPVTGAAGASEYVDVFVNSKTDRLMLGDAMTKIATAKGPVLIHCTYGKDRTGWLVAMIMYTLGANDSQVMTEYLKSASAGSDFKVDASWLNAALAAARAKNGGSIMNYIQSGSSGMGVSSQTIAALKAKVAK
jgi:protein-tyrosine phosphatase